MKIEAAFNIEKVAAITTGNNVITHKEHSPVELASQLLHEGGHVIAGNNAFTPEKVVNPVDIFALTLNLSSAKRRLLTELFQTNQPNGDSWIFDVIEMVYNSLDLLTKRTFDLSVMTLNIADTKSEFIDLIKGIDTSASGVYKRKSRRVAVLSEEAHSIEVPAYYIQFGGGIIVESTLTTDPLDAVSIHLGYPSTPSHDAAYRTVVELYEESQFPTESAIRSKWLQRSQAA